MKALDKQFKMIFYNYNIMFSYIFSFAIVFFPTYYFLQSKTFQNMLWSAGYLGMYAISKCEIMIKKIKPHFSFYNNKMLVIKNNQLVQNNELLTYDFIIHSLLDAKKIIYFDENHDFNKESKYILCDYGFISIIIDVEQDGKEYSINLKLKNENENYYIVGNVINKFIILYLSQLITGVQFQTTCKYNLNLIDQNVNIIKITEEDEIVLNLTNYEIRKYTQNVIGEIEIQEKKIFIESDEEYIKID